MKFNFTCLLLFSSILFLSFPVNAQDSLLNRYKFRTPGFRALQLNFDLTGFSAKTKRVNATEQSGSSFLSAASMNYFRIVSTEKKQRVTNLFFNPLFNTSSNKNNNSKQSTLFTKADLRWDFINRTFYKKNRFWEYGTILQSNNSGSGIKEGAEKSNFTFNEISNQLILGFGSGRLENVQDAQMALFILNALRQMGLLKQEPDATSQYQFAALITDINNRRVFDNRIRRIYELTRIDSFLQKSGLIKESSIAYFTTVNDNWALAFNPGRLSGTRLYAQMKPGLSYKFDQSERLMNSSITNKQSNNRFEYFYEPEIGIEHQKPINLHWQKTFSTSLLFRQRFIRSSSTFETPPVFSETKDFQTASFVNFRSFYGFGYYPNNRTLINGGIELIGNYTNNFRGIPDERFLNLNTGLSLSANYFISFRTRAFASTAFNWGYSEITSNIPGSFVYDKNRFNGNIQIGLSHIIF